jgi:cytochrome c-type biogenesis protein
VDWLLLSEMAQRSEALLSSALANPGPLTIALVFGGGALTSLGPCSLSLLPVTLAYLAGFEDGRTPWQRSLAFCSGIVGALVVLGSLSGLLGKIYGQMPALVPSLVAILAVAYGPELCWASYAFPFLLDLIQTVGATKFLPLLHQWQRAWLSALQPHPCTTPVVAVLLGWIAQSGRPLVGVALLTSFGIGQVLPLLVAGTFAGQRSKACLSFDPSDDGCLPSVESFFSQQGLLTLLARWS